MKKLMFLVLLVVTMLLLPADVYASGITLNFDSYGSYEDDINGDGAKEKVWIVPVGGSYQVDKARCSVDVHSFHLMYEMIDILPEPIIINGRSHSVQYIDIGTKKGLEWYGAMKTFVGSGTYEGPDTEYYFDKANITYVDVGSTGGNASFSDLASAIFSGNYPMSDPVPKEFYSLSAVKKGTADEIQTWYFKVLPYEYAAPATVKASVFGSDETFRAYNIKGYNYFKIRDLAAACKGTDHAFDVGWDEGGVNILMGVQSKDSISTESVGADAAHAVHSNGGILHKGDDAVSVECFMINGYNYYKIRDLAAFLGFTVSYDSKSGKINCQQGDINC